MVSLPVVHIIHFYSSPGGIELLSSRLLPSFSGYDFRVFVIRPPAKERQNVYEGAGVPVQYGSSNNLSALCKLFRYARRHREEVFHLFNPGPFYLLAVRLAGAGNIVYGIHGTRYWKSRWQRALHRPLWKLALRKNVKITSNSGYSRSVFLKEVCDDAEVTVLYNPVSNSRFVPSAERRESGPFKIIYTGRLDRGKNLEKWIDIAADLREKLDGSLFEIYGSGPMERLLTAKIRSLGAESYISLKGYRSDIENVFRDADLLLFLSEYESFGNVVVESILCGTPVIASDIPSMREIFHDYPIFLVASGGDISGQVASRLIDYGNLAHAARIAGDDFRERFSESNYIRQLNRIYSSFYG